MRAAKSRSFNGGACGSKRANFLNCRVVRQRTKHRHVYRFCFADSPRRTWAMPFSYSKTVMFANPTVSSLKCNGGVKALALLQAMIRTRAKTILEVISRLMTLLSATSARSAGSTVTLRRFGKIAEATEFFVALF